MAAELRATFTLASGPTWGLSGVRPTRWFAPAWNMLPLTARTCRVHNPLNGRVAELSADQYAVLSACDGCYTLGEHITNVRRKLRVDEQGVPTIANWLSSYVTAGLFVSFDDLIQRLGSGQIWVPPPFGGVFIRTCDRPALLQRVLNSAAVTESTARRYSYRILDDSRSPANRAANSRLASISGLDCTYYDLSQDSEIFQTLRHTFRQGMEELDWLFGSAHASEATYGRPVNIALLMSAGQRVLMLDDDALLSPRLPPLPSSGFCISSAHDELFCFPDRSGLEQACGTTNLDPVAGHLECLGIPARLLYDRFAGGDSNQLRMLDLTKDDGVRFAIGATVRLTQNHAIGDPGSSLFPYHLLTLPRKSREWLERDPLWRDYVFRDRYNWRGQECMRLTPNRPLTFTTLAGLDNSSMLPPTVRAHRNEDLLLGAITRLIDPTAWLCDLPWALPHFRDPAKTWLDLNVSFPQEPVHFLLDYIEQRASLIISKAAEDRLRTLGAIVLDLAAAGDSQITDMLEHQAADAASRARFGIAGQLDDPTISTAWKTMLEPWLRSPTLSTESNVLRSRLIDPNGIRDVARKYGRALNIWPNLWRWAKDRHASESG